MEILGFFDIAVSLATLTALEIVLGIDNIVMLTILVDKLPHSDQAKARQIGLALALLARLGFLASAAWVITLKDPLFYISEHGFSVRDIILFLGGLFLIAKATTEVFNFVELKEHSVGESVQLKDQFSAVIFQIVVFDLVFSLDSVLTAVGLTDQLFVMAIAVILAIIFMMIFANRIGKFVKENPAIKILALSFLVLIGVLLIAESFGSHFNRGTVYFAMAFSLLIEALNRRRVKKQIRSNFK